MNFTDKESRIITSQGFVQAYNGGGGCRDPPDCRKPPYGPNDYQELKPTLKSLKALEARLGSVDSVLADAGYFSEDNVKYCEKAEATPYIAVGREPHNLPWETLGRTCTVPARRRPGHTAMAHRLRTPEGKAIYAKRKSTVAVFGIIKSVLGFRQFHVRGRAAASGEWTLVCWPGI